MCNRLKLCRGHVDLSFRSEQNEAWERSGSAPECGTQPAPYWTASTAWSPIRRPAAPGLRHTVGAHRARWWWNLVGEILL